MADETNVTAVPTPQPTVAQRDPTEAYRLYARTRAEQLQLPPDIVEGVLDHESGFDPRAAGIRGGKPSGAIGIGQLTAATAVDNNLDPRERHDPYKNIDASLSQLQKINETFPGLKWSQKITAYNMGIKGYQDVLAGKRKLNPNDPEDAEALAFPERVQNSIVRVKEKRGSTNMQARSDGGVPASEGSIPPLPPDVPSPPDTSLTNTYLSNAPEAVQAMAYGVEQGGRLAGSGLKSMYDSAMQFPNDIAAVGGAAGRNAGQAIANATMSGPPQPFESLPAIDPTGIVNFASFPLGGMGGRAANTGLNAGLGVLNTADALARAQAEKEGQKWDDLGFGERASRIAAEVANTDNALPLAQNAILSAGLGVALGGKNPKAEADRLGAGRYTKLEAEEMLGTQRQKVFMNPAERRIANQEMRTALENQFMVPAVDPGSPFHQELSTKFGQRPLGPNIMDVDDYLTKLKETATKRGLLEGDPDRVAALNKLTDPIDPAHSMKVQLHDMYTLIRTTKSATVRAKTIAAARQLRDQIDLVPTPTVDDIVERMRNFDRLRRNKSFRDSVLKQDSGFIGILKDASKAIREPGGLMDHVLNPDEQALWHSGNNLSRIWNNDKRTLNIIADAFADGQAGGGKIRDELRKAHADVIIRRIGEGNYEDLLRLSRAVDVLTSKDPGGRVMRFIAQNAGRLKAPLGFGATGGFIGVAGGAAGAPIVGPALTGSIMGGLFGMLMTNRTAARQFEKLARLAGKPTSLAFARTFSRFMTTTMIHHAYAGQQTPRTDDDLEPGTKEAAPELTAREAIPAPPNVPVAGQRTGSPIPAPPTPAATGTPRVLNVQPLR